MSTKRTNFANWTIQNRLSDADYIKHLETQIENIDSRVEKFLSEMDKSMFQKDPVKVMGCYADNASLLRF